MSFLVQEIFHTLQGEGYWAGTPCDFIRLYGCPLRCPYCDTGYAQGGKGLDFYPIELDTVLSKLTLPRVVVTGGEPFLAKNLPSLCRAILDTGRKVHIETSGAFWQDVPEQVWITLSPKQHLNPNFPVVPPLWKRASEIKLVISDGTEIEFYQPYISFEELSCPIFLQPEWNERERTTPLVLQLLHRYTGMRLSLQTHKLIGIP